MTDKVWIKEQAVCGRVPHVGHPYTRGWLKDCWGTKGKVSPAKIHAHKCRCRFHHFLKYSTNKKLFKMPTRGVWGDQSFFQPRAKLLFPKVPTGRMESSLFSHCSCLNFAHKYILFFLKRLARATFKQRAGCMWPAGRTLVTRTHEDGEGLLGGQRAKFMFNVIQYTFSSTVQIKQGMILLNFCAQVKPFSTSKSFSTATVLFRITTWCYCKLHLIIFQCRGGGGVLNGWMHPPLCLPCTNIFCL